MQPVRIKKAKTPVGRVKGFAMHPKMIAAIDHLAKKKGVTGPSQNEIRAKIIRHLCRENLIREGLIEYASATSFLSNLSVEDAADLRFKT